MTRRKDGLWQETMTVTVNGRKKVKYFYGKTKAEVYRKIADYEEKSERGELFTFVSDEWWEEHESTLSPTSITVYRRGKRRMDEYFEGRYIRELVPADISQYMRYVVKTYDMAKRTADNHLIVANQIFKFAVAEGYCDANVARDITVPKNLKKSERVMPDANYIEKIKTSTDCTFGMFAYWLIYTGCRKGELLALTWDDVDFENHTISINKQVCYCPDGTTQIRHPKTKKGTRIVPLLNKLEEKIAPGKGLVFPYIDGGPLPKHIHQRQWEKYQKESGVKCTGHQLRHAYATMLYEAGIEPKDAQDLLGHAQLSTTMDVYTEIRESRRKKIRESLLDADI